MNRWKLIAHAIVSIFLTACTAHRPNSSVSLDPSVQAAIDQEYRLSDRSVLYFIDAHSQVDGLENSNFNYELEDIPQTMARNNVRGTILSARGKRDSYDILKLSRYHNGIYPSIRVKSGPYNSDTYSSQILEKVKNKIGKQFEQADSLADVEFYAISESLIYHAAKYNQLGHEIAPRVVVPLSDNRAVYIRKKAKEMGWPFVIHIEYRALRRDPISHSMFVPTMGLEEALADHRNVDFVLNHLGQLSASEVRDLITDHDNIYFRVS